MIDYRVNESAVKYERTRCEIRKQHPLVSSYAFRIFFLFLAFWLRFNPLCSRIELLITISANRIDRLYPHAF